MKSKKLKNAKNASMMALSLAALGVVFGDIGTSPLYAIREIFTINNNILELNEANMLGILSLNFLVIDFNSISEIYYFYYESK